MKKTVYLFTDGQVSRKDNTFVFQSATDKRFLPIEQIGEIYVFGEVDVTKKFLELASKNEILIHYFNYYGYYVGTFYPREHLNSGYMILKQAEAYMNEESRLGLANKFVMGAVENIERVLKYYERRKEGFPSLLLEQLGELKSQIMLQESVEALMAIEGNIRNLYYSAFDFIIGDPNFKFVERSRRPPKNELNTLISFGNSMVYTTVLSQIYRTHLDPRIGYLHATNFRSFSLNLDVAEIFKPIIVDRLIFNILNHKAITKNDFYEDSGGIIMKETGKKTFVSEFDKRLKTTIKLRGLGRSVSYRTLIRLELYKIQKHLMGEKEYKPFVASW